MITTSSIKADSIIKLTALYETGIQKHQAEKQKLLLRSTWIAAGRLTLFVFTIAAIWGALKTGTPLLLLPAAAALAGFLALLRAAVVVKQRIRFLETIITINREELKALANDLSPFDPGNDFIDFHHHYTYDLDIFGEHSLFRLVSRTATPRGRQLLAERLMIPEQDPEIIRHRQDSVTELTGMTDWWQTFQATARESGRDDSREVNFKGWLSSPDQFSHNLFFTLSIFLNAFLTTSLTVLYLLHTLFPVLCPLSLPSSLFLWFLVPVSLIISRTRLINREQLRLEKLLGLFRKYSSLLKLIEEQKFMSPALRDLQESLGSGNLRASRILEKLAVILWGLEVRGNLIVSFFLNAYFLWDILQMIRLEKWRMAHGAQMDKWLGAIAEFEVLGSLANLVRNRPDLTRPEILEGAFRMEITDGGHPLINPSRRVDNSLSFDPDGRIYLITGANMAGKSTLLRMVGTNMVLAMAGGPVCARKFSMVPVSIHTSVRTNDSLGDDESYFYAELKRLSAIIRRAESGEKPFIIIDEMLKGTNSRDKHTGSAALIRRLIGLGASGLAATHDVELGELEKEFPGRLVNCCFEVDTGSGQLSFDYKLRPGVSKNLNATFLMRKMGIIPETF